MPHFQRTITASILATLLIGAAPINTYAHPSAQAPSVTATPVIYKQIERNLGSLGTLTSNQAINIAAQIGGRVTELSVEDGSQVQKGDVLIQLDAREQEAMVKDAEISLQDAKRQYDYMVRLFEKRAVSQDELEAQQARVERAQATLASQQANLDYYTITAPFSGILGFNDLSTGAMISAGADITTLDDLSSMKLYFDLPENTFSEIRSGTEIQATTDAWPGVVFKGVIDTINPRIDPLNLTFTARATLDNAEDQLRPGMLMRLDVMRPVELALTVPARSVLFDGNEQYVYVLDEESIPQQQFIETGVILEEKITVISGLQEGDSIIDQGVVKVNAGRPVTILQQEVAETQEISEDSRS